MLVHVCGFDQLYVRDSCSAAVDVQCVCVFLRSDSCMFALARADDRNVWKTSMSERWIGYL